MDAAGPRRTAADETSDTAMGTHPEPWGYLRACPDGTFTEVRADGTHGPYPVPSGEAAELRNLLGMRDTARELLEAEAATPHDTPHIDALRRDLGERYDGYAAHYGPVGRYTEPSQPGRAPIRPSQGGFRSDLYAPVVYALERCDPASGQVAKAEIFTQRVVTRATGGCAGLRAMFDRMLGRTSAAPLLAPHDPGHQAGHEAEPG